MTTTNDITNNTTGTNLLLSVCSNAVCRHPTLYISLSHISVSLSSFVLIKLPLLTLTSDSCFCQSCLIIMVNFGMGHCCKPYPSMKHPASYATSLCTHFSPKLKELFTLFGRTAGLTHKQQWTIWSRGFGRAWIFRHSSVYDMHVELPFLSLTSFWAPFIQEPR